jgi:hypothetical protein
MKTVFPTLSGAEKGDDLKAVSDAQVRYIDAAEEKLLNCPRCETIKIDQVVGGFSLRNGNEAVATTDKYPNVVAAESDSLTRPPQLQASFIPGTKTQQLFQKLAATRS